MDIPTNRVDLGVDPIYTFTDLVRALLEFYDNDFENLNPEFYPIFKSGLDTEFTAVKAACINIHKISRPEFRELLKFILVEHLLRLEIIPDEYYPLLLETARRIQKFIPPYDIGFYVDQISLRQMNKTDANIDDFDMLVKCYNFWCNFQEALGQSYDVTTEMITMMCPINTYLYKNIGEASYDTIGRMVRLCEKAEEHGAVLEGFRLTFKTFVRNWMMADRVPPGYDLESLDPKTLVPSYKKIDYTQDELPVLAEKVIVNGQLISEEELFDHLDIIETISAKNDMIKVKVYKCKCAYIADYVAVKEVIAMKESDLVSFQREAKCYEALSGASENFLKYYGMRMKQIEIGSSIKFKLEIMMEFVEKSLKDDKQERLHSNKPYTEDEIKHIYDQLIESFNILRAKNILHCDIKPSNLLVTGDLTIKIIDFNIARTEVHDTTQAAGAFGTLDYMAPEIRIGKESDCQASFKEDKADVFSLGMTILFLVMDKPESNLNLEVNRGKLQAIVEGIKQSWLKNSLKSMLEFDYKIRASLKTLIRAYQDGKNNSITVDT